MFEVKETGIAGEYINCESCGCHDNDIKSVLVHQTAVIKGKRVRIGGRIVELRLCRSCRKELSDILKTQ